MLSRLSGILFAFVSMTLAQSQPSHWKNAPTPPMGWNSWDCFGTTLTEAQAKAEADAMAEHLKPFGRTYFTVDIQWQIQTGLAFSISALFSVPCWYVSRDSKSL
jgi:alpha-galactosidase